MENEYIVCQNCGEKNSTKNNYCGKCATPLREPFEKTPTRQENYKIKTEFIICKNCGEENSEINDYCQACSSLIKEYYQPQNKASTQEYYPQRAIKYEEKTQQEQKATSYTSFKLQNGKGTGGCLLMILIIISIYIFGKITMQNNNTSTTSSSPQTNIVATPTLNAEELRSNKITNLFSLWDGSFYNLNVFIKSQMNNPKSFEHVETVYWDMKDYLVVRTTYRGTNAYGGIVTNWIKVKVSLDGEIIDILETG